MNRVKYLPLVAAILQDGIAMADIWSRLSLYESRDLVSQLYQQRHGGQINAAKAGEIVAHIAQGKEYFQSAQGASQLVSPLLLYYGVLSLSRGIILFLDKGAREATLSESHGLETLQWKEDLSVGSGKTEKLKLKIGERGTFRDLSRVTQNAERAMLMGYAIPPEERHGMVLPHLAMILRTETDIVPAALVITLEEILERLPEIVELFETTFGRHSKCYNATIEMNWLTTFTTCKVKRTALGLPAESEVRDALRITPETMFELVGAGVSYGEAEHYQFRLNHGSSEEADKVLPQVINDDQMNMFLVSPLASGWKLSPLLLRYLFAYAMGMLVRYHPSYWLSLIGKHKGDRAFPVLQSAVSSLQHHFPELIYNELANVGASNQTATS